MSESISAQDFERVRASLGFAAPVEAYEGFPLAAGFMRTRIVVGNTTDRSWGAVAEYAHSRVVPWRTVLRVIRAPGLAPNMTSSQVTSALAKLAKGCKALRTHVEVFEQDADRRARLEAALTEAGFVRAQKPRRYTRTIKIDLAPTEEQLLASFHPSCRRHIKSFSRKSLLCLPIEDPALAPRLQQLLDETMTRTRGPRLVPDWPGLVAFIERNPNRARLLGAFRSDIGGPEALVGYVLGLRHSDSVEYRTAASTRLDELKAPLLYAPAWELMRWARSTGASRFDFGGVIPATMPAEDPRHGISNFKRMFSTVELDVGGEYVLEATDFVARTVKAVWNRQG